MELLNWTCDKAYKIKAAVESVFRPNYYVFFKGTPFAYDSGTVSTFGTGSKEVEWVYSPTDQAFFAWNNTIFSSLHNYANVTHPIPVLSLEIVNKETKEAQYDLTEFLEKMTVRSPLEKHRNPSVAEILAAWSIHSSIVVDSDRFFVRLMDTAANELETVVDDQVPLGGKVESESETESEPDYQADSDTAPTESTGTPPSTEEDTNRSSTPKSKKDD